jgi:PemK-like, MazF-like toxin of type II toxin-antitoxin system
MNFIKNFLDWFTLKPKLEDKFERLKFKEREIWYLHFGANIGFEIDGKAEYLRPCLIIKKISNETFFAIPLTSKLKNGSWYHPSLIKGKEGRYIFSQMRILDAKRLNYFVETINKEEFENIKVKFIEFFKT